MEWDLDDIGAGMPESWLPVSRRLSPLGRLFRNLACVRAQIAFVDFVGAEVSLHILVVNMRIRDFGLSHRCIATKVSLHDFATLDWQILFFDQARDVFELFGQVDLPGY